MKSEKLVQFAAKQTAIIVAVTLCIPVIGIVATLLLVTVADLFGEQFGLAPIQWRKISEKRYTELRRQVHEQATKSPYRSVPS